MLASYRKRLKMYNASLRRAYARLQEMQDIIDDLPTPYYKRRSIAMTRRLATMNYILAFHFILKFISTNKHKLFDNILSERKNTPIRTVDILLLFAYSEYEFLTDHLIRKSYKRIYPGRFVLAQSKKRLLNSGLIVEMKTTDKKRKAYSITSEGRTLLNKLNLYLQQLMSRYGYGVYSKKKPDYKRGHLLFTSEATSKSD